MRLGVLIVGLNGATATTFVASARLLAARRIQSCGLMTASPAFKTLPAPDWGDIVFGGWDVDGESLLNRTRQLAIVPEHLCALIASDLSEVRPFPAIASRFDTIEVRNAPSLKSKGTFREAVESVKEDIEAFTVRHGTEQNIVFYLGSPLALSGLADCPNTEEEFAAAQSSDYQNVPSAITYCLAAIEARCAFVDFTPNPTLEIAYLLQRATEMRVPVAGRDGSTGQTLLKALLSEMLSVRTLPLHGWYSTNILGNHDGSVLARPEHATIKMRDKLGVLPAVLGYDSFDHKVDITFYGPRGDNKESWDVIDFGGLLGLPMSLRLNWQGRDSPLAAGLLLDLTRLVGEGFRRSSFGLQRHLGVFFKNPIGSKEHGYFRQYLNLLDWCGVDWKELP